MMKKVASVDEYIARSEHWQDELARLCGILRACDLDETIKWGAPCYTHAGKNVVGVGAFKAYCGLWFHQGVFLSDPEGVLINAQDGKTRGLRQWRFTSGRQIRVRTIKSYVNEAIELARAGREIKPQRNREIELPAELSDAFGRDVLTREAFEALTPGRQREFASYIAEAKRAATRQGRIEKIIPLIRAGKGLHDKYRNC